MTESKVYAVEYLGYTQYFAAASMQDLLNKIDLNNVRGINVFLEEVIL